MKTKIIIPLGQSKIFTNVLSKNKILYEKEIENERYFAYYITWKGINAEYYFNALMEVWRTITGKYFAYKEVD